MNSPSTACRSALVALLSVACLAAVVASSGARGAAADEGEPPRSRLSPESSPHAVLSAIFEATGWPKHIAIAHATNALARLDVEGYTYQEAPALPAGFQNEAGRSLLSPLTDVHATLTRAFTETGWSFAEARSHVKYMLEKEGMPVVDETTTCQVREIVIQYCEGEKVKYFQGYLHIQCFWQLFPDPIPGPCPAFDCVAPAVPWFTMHSTGGCSIGYEGCVRVYFGDVATVACRPSILGCSCFEEDSCEDITGVKCCPPLELSGSGGCTGCPCVP